MSSRAHTLTRIPLLPDFLFRVMLYRTVIAGLNQEWADETHPKYEGMVASYRERIANEPAFGRSLLSSARHFPMESLQESYAAAGAGVATGELRLRTV